MKRTVTILATCLCLGMSAHALMYEPTLTPSGKTFGDRPYVYPLTELGVQFDRGIKLFDGATAVIKCDGEIVTTATALDIVNEQGSKRTQGNLILHFEQQNLPKGKDYVLSISQGAVGWVELHNEIQVINPELNIPFSVPENLGEAQCEARNPALTDSEDLRYLHLFWGIETAPVGEPKFLLYREGEKVGEAKARVSYDWNLGQAYAEFDEKINFDFGVNYTLVLPEGSVSTLYREDIVNERFELNFIGYYTDPSEQFTYKWCSLFDNHTDLLGEVSFTYDRSISLADNATVQLWEGDGESLVKEVTPWIRTDVNCWILTADFGGIRLDSPKGYTIVIPEGAIISDDEIGVTSKHSELRVSGYSGIEAINAERNAGRFYDLSGRKVTHPQPGHIYIVNGKKALLK